MNSSRPLSVPLACLVGMVALAIAIPSARAGNVTWLFINNVAGCPAGDTVIVSGLANLPPHPSLLRIAVTYNNSDGSSRNGVPPESIWVDITPATGNLKVNDETRSGSAWRIYAADSTRNTGFTRILVPSCSGCGTVNLTLYVAGVNEGTSTATIRTVDSNADGICNSSDVASACDLNYDGKVDNIDKNTVSDNASHWHRFALHGAMVRRTNLSYVVGGPGAIGESSISWSPNNRWLAFTVETTPNVVCKVFTVASDPRDGDGLTQQTFATAPDSADYDPSWSPLGSEFTFGREDNTVYRKNFVGNADQSVHLVTHHDDGSNLHRGDLTAAISPDGQWVAFGRRDTPNSPYHIWKIPTNGDSTRIVQLTFETSGTDFYPEWSPDGQTIVFDRADSIDVHHLYRVAASGSGGPALLFSTPGGKDAVTPGYSPDSLVVTAGIGTHPNPNPVRDVGTYTLNPASTASLAIPSYSDTSFKLEGPDPVLSPRLSPDGTRLAVRSRQIWAVRRNMDKPPAITNVSGSSIADTTVYLAITATVGQNLSIQFSASDPESDPLTYSAFFLQSGMAFNSTTHTLTWNPVPGPTGKTYFVKFRVTEASGGTDQLLVGITTASLGPARLASLHVEQKIEVLSPNPSSVGLVVRTPRTPSVSASLRVFDLAGREVWRGVARSGATIRWPGSDANGRAVPVGLYVYRVDVGSSRQTGKVMVTR